MKKILMILMIAILLPAAAFAGQPQDGKQKPTKDTTDWLNAPTPDGSPTLKETSDWLAKTVRAYNQPALSEVHIDSSCNFSSDYSTASDKGFHASFPLGAVTQVTANVGQPGVSVTAVKLTTGNVNAVSWKYGDGTTLASSSIAILITETPQAVVGAEIPEAPEQMIRRVAKALQHAVDLCRTTYQPPAQAKQPF